MKGGNEGIFNDEGKSEVFIEQAENSNESINQCYGKCSVGGGENDDIGNSTIITGPAESGNKTEYAHDIVIDPRESNMQINKNNHDNSDVAES